MKNIVGIIAEYNPFHKGHAYHIQESRKRLQADYVLVLMSGDFVQRGTPAIFSKHARTKMALLGGADAVLELPYAYACSSAEYFARGAVELFHALGCVNLLSFGSEAGMLTPFLSTAQLLKRETPIYQKTLKEQLKKGVAFPLARKSALLELLKSSQKFSEIPEDFFDTPNNILGIEYCKALATLHSPIQPFTLQRQGNAYHETQLSSPLSSASALRRCLLAQQQPAAALPLLAPVLPKPVLDFLEELLAVHPLISENDYALLLQYKLLKSQPEAITAYADVSRELAQRIYRHLNHFDSFSGFAKRLKSKELTFSRLQRALLHILLELPEDMPRQKPSYVRLLGFQRKSSALLRDMQKQSSIPLLTKAGDYRKQLSPSAASAFEKDVFASNLYEAVLCAKAGTPFVHDLQKTPIIL